MYNHLLWLDLAPFHRFLHKSVSVVPCTKLHVLYSKLNRLLGIPLHERVSIGTYDIRIQHVRVQCEGANSNTSYVCMYMYKVEPLNNGHNGTFSVVPCVDSLSSPRRLIYTQNLQLVCFSLPFFGGCHYFRVSFISGTTINDNSLY